MEEMEDGKNWKDWKGSESVRIGRVSRYCDSSSRGGSRKESGTDTRHGLTRSSPCFSKSDDCES